MQKLLKIINEPVDEYGVVLSEGSVLPRNWITSVNYSRAGSSTASEAAVFSNTFSSLLIPHWTRWAFSSVWLGLCPSRLLRREIKLYTASIRGVASVLGRAPTPHC